MLGGMHGAALRWRGCSRGKDGVGGMSGAGSPKPWGQRARCPLGSSTRTYEVVLGEYDMSSAEGPEQRIPVAADDIFVHPKWNSLCLACG